MTMTLMTMMHTATVTAAVMATAMRVRRRKGERMTACSFCERAHIAQQVELGKSVDMEPPFKANYRWWRLQVMIVISAIILLLLLLLMLFD